jgi:hypothetical protein
MMLPRSELWRPNTREAPGLPLAKGGRGDAWSTRESGHADASLMAAMDSPNKSRMQLILAEEQVIKGQGPHKLLNRAIGNDAIHSLDQREATETLPIGMARANVLHDSRINLEANHQGAARLASCSQEAQVTGMEQVENTNSQATAARSAGRQSNAASVAQTHHPGREEGA